MSFVVIIPACYAPIRLPGKPLLDINGKPTIMHALERTHESGVRHIIVVTDHEDVAHAVGAVGDETYMTCTDHQSDTERLVEAAEKCGSSNDITIVNVQGDEPMILTVTIRQVTENPAQRQVGVATFVTPIHSVEEAFSPNVVKVALGVEGYAPHLSRATIPWG